MAARVQNREKVEARIRERWGRESLGAIGCLVGYPAAEVAAIAVEMGLGENPYEAPVPATVPPKPLGFSRAQRAWARVSRTEEALLIRGILGELKLRGERHPLPADPAAKGMGLR